MRQGWVAVTCMLISHFYHCLHAEYKRINMFTKAAVGEFKLVKHTNIRTVTVYINKQN